jgi:mRNA-decapping enzyme subunit 2
MMAPRDLPPHLLYDSDPAESSSPRPQDDEGDASEENMFRDMTLDEILEDLHARFLINLPREEMSLVRVYWQAEQA